MQTQKRFIIDMLFACSIDCSSQRGLANFKWHTSVITEHRIISENVSSRLPKDCGMRDNQRQLTATPSTHISIMYDP